MVLSVGRLWPWSCLAYTRATPALATLPIALDTPTPKDVSLSISRLTWVTLQVKRVFPASVSISVLVTP